MQQVLFKDLQEGQSFMIGRATYTKGRSNGIQGAWCGSSWRFVADDKAVKIKSESII